jgi:hypothetical protein
MLKVTTNFSLCEFIPKIQYDEMGDKSIILMDARIFPIAQAIRNKFGTITINDWFWEGKRTESGWRPSFTSTGAKYSQHKFGRAIDCLPKEHTAEEIRDQIRKNEPYWYQQGIRCIENNVSWLHVDVRNTGLSKILWIDP